MNRMLRRTLGMAGAAALGLTFAAAPAGATTISLWTQSAGSDWLSQVLDKFTEQTGIQVDVKKIDWGLDKLYVALAAGTPPDLFTHGNAALGAFAAKDALTPLDSLVSTWDFARDAVPSVMAINTYDGKQMALPWYGVKLSELVYRSDMLSEAGLAAPPKTWAELKSVGRKLVRTDAQGKMTRSALEMPDSGHGAQQAFFMLWHQLGGRFLVDGQPALTAPEATQALGFYADLFNADHLDEIGRGGSVLNDSAAMQLADLSTVLAAPAELRSNVQVAEFPYGAQPSGFLSADFVAMPRSAPHPKEAAALLKFLLDPAQQNFIDHQKGLIPFYKQAAHWDWVQQTPQMVTFLNLLPSGLPNPNHPMWIQMRNAMEPLIADALRQKLPPQSALTQAQTAVLGVLAGQ